MSKSTCTLTVALAFAFAATDAESAPGVRFSARTTAALSGSLVEGEIAITNRGRSTGSVDSLHATIEVRLPAYASPGDMKRGRPGHWTLATIDVPTPGPIAPRETVRIPFRFDLCTASVPPDARSLRAVGVLAAGERTVRAQSKKMTPPLDVACDETCDAAACNDCKSTCSDGAACMDACWAGFASCLAGCTTTYCAPFCQVDYGRCLDACPTTTGCSTACETENGCSAGCSAP